MMGSQGIRVGIRRMAEGEYAENEGGNEWKAGNGNGNEENAGNQGGNAGNWERVVMREIREIPMDTASRIDIDLMLILR